MSPDRTVDVLVVGSGGAALTAAFTASYHGQSVLVVEKESVLGGTTAVSGGQIWTPLNRQSAKAGISDTPDAIRAYIRHEAGEDFEPAHVDAFIANAANMIAFIEDNTEMKYTYEVSTPPDYGPGAPGWTERGRSLIPARYDSRTLDAGLARLIAPKRPLTTLVGGMHIGSIESAHFTNALHLRSWASVWHVAKRILRHFYDIVVYGRTTLLYDGNALIASLLKAVKDRGVEIWTSSPAVRLIKENGAVRGAVVSRQGGETTIHVNRAVILGSGGFGHNAERRKQIFAHVAEGSEHLSAASLGNTGDAMRMGEEIGATIRTFKNGSNGAFAPMIYIPTEPVPNANWPVFSGRGAPGTVAVMSDGKRFTSEAVSYHDFVRNMIRRAKEIGQRDVSCWLILDHRTLRQYGTGAGLVKPFPYPLGKHLRSGVLIRTDTIDELAARLKVDGANLKETVRRMNSFAQTGKDVDFRRGENAYERKGGDPRRKPNGNLGPIETAPFYAIKLQAGHIGAFAGLQTDPQARVTNGNGQPIPGLYAVGNDMASPFGGDYAGRGGTLGPGMTFAYIAARHAAGVN